MRNVNLVNIRVEAEKPGSIAHAADWNMRNVIIATPTGGGPQLKDAAGVVLPQTPRSASTRRAATAQPGNAADIPPAQHLGLGNTDHGDGRDR